MVISLQLSTAEHRPSLKRATLFGPPLSSSSVHRRFYEYRRTSGSEVVLRYAYRDAVSTLGLVCSSGHQSYDRYGQPTAISACFSFTSYISTVKTQSLQKNDCVIISTNFVKSLKKY
ncbi:hypothetical protein O3G_MSEX001555 [Manduca sexta]|uniref:Uncharacterized protein n=1 Tax=Manduca sexta TaxID=7130 RepID=A0A921YKJ9_MANSE|nr:hypothetical protein O3G_MSEX001555 [Manduca sexta]